MSCQPAIPSPREPHGDVRAVLASTRIPEDTAYGDPVPRTDPVDRDAWASLLTELLDAAGATPETACQPRGPLDVTPQTIYRWKSRAMGVTAHQVRDVCRAFGYPPIHGLVRVGFLGGEEAGIAGPAKVAGPDPLLRRLAHDLTNPTLPDAARAELRRALSEAHQSWLRMLKAFAKRPLG